MRVMDKKLLPSCGQPFTRPYRQSGYVDAVDSRHARIKYRGRLLYLRQVWHTGEKRYPVSDFSSWTLAENWISVCHDNSLFVSRAWDLSFLLTVQATDPKVYVVARRYARRAEGCSVVQWLWSAESVATCFIARPNWRESRSRKGKL